MKYCTVSGIMPVYNGAATLAEAIDSVLAQTFRDFEIILVDDGSTDTTPEVVKRYRGKLRYYHIANCGGADARNYGVSKSNGKLLAFLDADDRWHPEKLARSVEAIHTNRDAAMVCTAYALIASDGRTVVPHVHLPILAQYYPRL